MEPGDHHDLEGSTCLCATILTFRWVPGLELTSLYLHNCYLLSPQMLNKHMGRVATTLKGTVGNYVVLNIVTVQITNESKI